MAVERIEEYVQKDGTGVLKVILTPQKAFPNGSYFYCDAEDIDLVEGYTWYLDIHRNTAYVKAFWGSGNIKFHQELALKKLGHYIECIDHRNRIGFDNCDENLFSVSSLENEHNKVTRGYHDEARSDYKKGLIWRVLIKDGKAKFYTVQNEVEACISRCNLEKEHYVNPYGFILDRSQALDLLDLERTGKISADEATYRHVMKYADNAWYYYRYGLEDYFKQNNIPVPQYALDEQGYMVHPITGQKLCPLTK